MMSFGSQKFGNNTLRSSRFVSGNLTIRDFVKYGGGDYNVGDGKRDSGGSYGNQRDCRSPRVPISEIGIRIDGVCCSGDILN